MEGAAGGWGHRAVVREAVVRDDELDTAIDMLIEKVRRTARGLI